MMVPRRTWLFLDNILAWYDSFNHVRTEIFTQRNLFKTGVPASTGVGAKNPYNAALVAGAWAVEPHRFSELVTHVGKVAAMADLCPLQFALGVPPTARTRV